MVGQGDCLFGTLVVGCGTFEGREIGLFVNEVFFGTTPIILAMVSLLLKLSSVQEKVNRLERKNHL